MSAKHMVVAQAAAILKHLPKPANAAVVFDIDDTLIDGITARPIKPVISLYNLVKRLGFATFIVTNRVAGHESYTDNQLESVGVSGYVSIYFRHPDVYDFWGAKLSARKHIAKRGYVTVMSIGDQLWDVGEYGGYGVIIPA